MLVSNLEKVYSFSHLFTRRPILEITSRELRASLSHRVNDRQKSQHIKATYLGVDKRTGDLLFKTNSGTTPGKFWHQRVRLLDLPTARDLAAVDGSISDMKIINLAIFGDIALHCDDPSFRYYWSYIAFQLGYGLRRESRFPKIRNPRLEGSICKHLVAVLKKMPLLIPKIVSDLRKAGLFNLNYPERKKEFQKKF